MKSYHLESATRIWTSRLVAAGLGLTGLTCLGAPPSSSENPASTTTAAANNDSQPQSWEDQFTAHMQHIQKEMDDLFRDSLNNIDTADKGFFSGPKFDASATVQDRGGNYVATFNLPKRDLSNVKVNVKDGVLSVKASAEQTTKSNATGNNTPATETEMLDQYEQLVTLPGPVDAGRMNIDKQGDSIIVTIPKKEDKTASAR